MSVSFVTNAGNLAARKRILAGKTQERFRRAAQVEAAKMKFVAQSLSGGRLSLAQLQRMGHPYARRFPAGFAGQPDYIINIQSGDLNRGWRTRVQKTSKGYTVTLYNVSPHARFMTGTQYMRYRGILDRVSSMTQRELPNQVKKVTRWAVQQNGSYSVPVSTVGGVLYAFSVGLSSAVGGLESAGIGSAFGR